MFLRLGRRDDLSDADSVSVLAAESAIYAPRGAAASGQPISESKCGPRICAGTDESSIAARPGSTDAKP